jgi:RHS repeat-associated protein
MQVHESEGYILNSPTSTQNANYFKWNYLPGSDLKSSLTYPNGLTASWQYDANNQLLQVRNASPTNVISQYDYTYDAAGRRIACAKSGSAFTQDDTVAYGYNNRSELTNAVAAFDSNYSYAYDFDDIGNRKSSSARGTNSVYTANQLNQYTMVGRVVPNAPQDAFVPQFDDDGNQTLIKTATGIWQVQYNGENRPILWTLVNSSTPNSSTPSLISMSYDRMGRRVTKNDQRFIYDGYLCIGKIEDFTSIHYSLSPIHCFVWDPTEPIATRPLVWNSDNSTSFYTHDGNKNVSEVIVSNSTVVAHYEYAPFGSTTVHCGEYAVANPWRFSSEYGEDESATVYYNYRHADPIAGRWLSRDAVDRELEPNVFAFINNRLIGWDVLGERYGNPVTDPHGNPLAPSSPYDPGGAYNPYLEWYDLLPNCPCCIDITGAFPKMNPKDANDKGWGNIARANPEHPGATWEVRWVDPLGIRLQGQQCTYDDKGRLITEPPAAGTPDMVSFDGDKHSVFSLHFWGHAINDWSTYKILFYNRDIYFRHWPPNNGNNCPRNFGNQK